jgi:tetratricopeptide (TPR) repeat protein
MSSYSRFFFALLISLCAGLAHAQAPTDPVAQGKEHFRRGTQLYDLGKYAEAAAEYEQAFKLTDKPLFLFNIGQAYRLAQMPKEALAAYRGFLRRVPDSPMRPEVEQYVIEYERQEEAAAAARAAASQKPPVTEVKISATTTPPTKPAGRPWWKRGWIWGVVGGVLVVGAGVGVGVGLGTQSRSPTPTYGTVTF